MHVKAEHGLSLPADQVSTYLDQLKIRFLRTKNAPACNGDLSEMKDQIIILTKVIVKLYDRAGADYPEDLLLMIDNIT